MDIAQELLNRVIALYSPTLQVLRSLGGSDGAVFEVLGPSGPAILKVIPKRTGDLPRVRAQEAFRDYVAQHGVPTAVLVPAADGEKVPFLETENTQYAITLHARIEGHPPDVNEIVQGDGRLLEEWGRIMGRMHTLAPGFQSEVLHNWEDECQGFFSWCQEEDIRREWEQMRIRLAKLPLETDSFGVIHNDLHPQNLILSSNGLVAIDFSVCCYHWFGTDIGVAAFTWSWLGKPRSGETRTSMLHRCFASFYEGYSKEHQLTEAWLERLPLFLDYRRLLLYTVFTQEWGNKMNSWQRNLLSEWRQAILTGLPVVHSLM